MTTQINKSDLDQMTEVHPVRPGWRWPLVAIATVMIALVVGFLWAGQSALENQTQARRALEADATRYSGLAGDYLAKAAANQERALETEAARYTSLAKFYLIENKFSIPQAFAADAARYQALAAYYLKKDEANRQRAIEAEVARYNGLTRFFRAGKVSSQ